MATPVTKIIDPDAGAGYHYLSGNAWETAEEKDLTSADEIAIAKCRSTSGSADTTAVLIGESWVTSATQYIKYWTDPAESYRSTNGKYDTSKYRIERADGDQMFIREEFVEIDGIQFKTATTSDSSAHCISLYHSTGIGATNQITIHNCIMVGVLSSTGKGYGLRSGSQGNANWNVDFYNNIVYDMINGSYGLYGVYPEYVTTFNIYNCTFHNCYRAVYSTGSKTLAKNVISQDMSNDGFYGTFNSNSDYNCSDISSDAPGSNSQTGEVTFADEANDDFKLDSSDTVALDNGVDLSSLFTDDILGSTRSGSWDIGAHEYQVANVTVEPTPVSAIAGKVDPTPVAGSLSLSPTFRSAIVSVIAPAIILGSSIATPSASDTIAGINAPSIVQSSMEILPDAGSAIADTLLGDAIQASLVLTPSPVSAGTEIRDPLPIEPEILTAVASSLIGDVQQGSLTFTGSVSAITTSVDPTVEIAGNILIAPTPGYAIGKRVNPFIDISNIIVTTSPADVISDLVAPTVVYGSLNLSPASASVIARGEEPGVSVSGLLATPAPSTVDSDRVNPTVRYGSTIASPDNSYMVTGTVIGNIIQSSTSSSPTPISSICVATAPTVAISDLVATPSSPADVISGKLDPTVFIGNLNIFPVPVNAGTDGLDPSISIGQAIATPAPISAIASAINPSIEAGDITIVCAPCTATALSVGGTPRLSSTEVSNIIASSIATVSNPVAIEGSLTFSPVASAVISSVSPMVWTGWEIVEPGSIFAIVDTTTPLVELGDVDIFPAPISAIASAVNPLVITPQVAIRVTVVTKEKNTCSISKAELVDISISKVVQHSVAIANRAKISYTIVEKEVSDVNVEEKS